MKNQPGGRRILLVALASLFFARPAGAGKDSYQQKAERELNGLSRKIDDFRAQSERAGEKTRDEIQTDVQVLQGKLANARQELDHLKTSTAKEWRPFRQKVQQALSDLKQTYGHAVQRFHSKIGGTQK